MNNLIYYILQHLLRSLLLAIRYGLIALLLTGGIGIGCRKWPLIKPKPSTVASFLFGGGK